MVEKYILVVGKSTELCLPDDAADPGDGRSSTAPVQHYFNASASLSSPLPETS